MGGMEALEKRRNPWIWSPPAQRDARMPRDPYLTLKSSLKVALSL
jgi:hypothetical protein